MCQWNQTLPGRNSNLLLGSTVPLTEHDGPDLTKYEVDPVRGSTMDPDEGIKPEKGEQYKHPDGLLEVVFAVDEDRVLTFREYPDIDSFAHEIGDAQYIGLNKEVSSMPGIETFRDQDL